MPENSKTYTYKVMSLIGGMFVLLISVLTSNTQSTFVEQKIPLETRVISVIDGDTIKAEINGEQKTIRLIGIDSPETKHPSKPVQCFGKEASAKLTSLLLGKEITLEKDVSDIDRYGRMLRYVYVDEEMINKTMVEEGYAYAKEYYPDVKYSETLKRTQEYAKDNNLGLWNPNTCNGVQ